MVRMVSFFGTSSISLKPLHLLVLFIHRIVVFGIEAWIVNIRCITSLQLPFLGSTACCT
jgi:hypothetical protein